MRGDVAPAASVFIPSYNAAKTLEAVVDRIPDDAWEIIDTVFILNDGSADDTLAVAERIAASHERVSVFNFEENQGYGRVVVQGLKLCLETDAEYFVCLHSDGQYPPEHIREFVDHMAAENIDFLQGSRHKDGGALKGGMPMYKWAIGKVMTSVENLIFGLRMTDYHSGFVFYRRRAVRSVPIETLSGYFDFDLAFIANARKRGLKISELGIPTHYGDEVSHLDPLKYGVKTLIVLWNFVSGRYNPTPEQLAVLREDPRA